MNINTSLSLIYDENGSSNYDICVKGQFNFHLNRYTSLGVWDRESHIFAITFQVIKTFVGGCNPYATHDMNIDTL